MNANGIPSKPAFGLLELIFYEYKWKHVARKPSTNSGFASCGKSLNS